MLKLTEICSIAAIYDPVSKSCKVSPSLREVYLNPDHIILMRENTSLKSKVQRGHLIEGMDKDLSFTELVISTPGHMSKIVNIVGPPEKIFEDYKKIRL